MASRRRPSLPSEVPSFIETVAPTVEAPAGTTWYDFESTRVREAAYDPAREALFVRFVKPEPYGTPWVYEGVPPNVWRNFRRSGSAGRFINRVLNNYMNHRGTEV